MMAGEGTPAGQFAERDKILVVDDLQDNLDLLVAALEDGPWTVATALDAGGALQQASETTFDLFVLDVKMPGVDGLGLCRRLRRDPHTRNVPVIFVTAERTSTKSVIEGLDAGGLDYIIKPFDRMELLARVRVMLRLRKAEKELLIVQDALSERNRELSAANDRLAEACQEMLQQRVELMHKARELEHASHAKSKFLAKMSHELRTPLNSIIGFTDLMLVDKKHPPTERQSRRLEKVSRNAKHLLALINDILDLSKIEADRLTLEVAPVDVAALARECVELSRPLLQDKPVTLEARVHPGGRTWEGDQVRLRQILMNLLSNAAKFTDRGTITLEVTGTDERLCISVCDTGIGIAPEHLSEVFERFRQVDSCGRRRARGTGLGLSICRKLCTLMGGTVEAASELGKGSTFKVELPWRPEKVEGVKQSIEDACVPATHPLVLVCTDDAGMVDLTTAHLSGHGIDVRHVDDQAGLLRPGRDEHPSAVMIDARWPSAIEALRHLKAIEPPVDHLWLTAWTEDHQFGYLLQTDDFAVEPLDGGAVRLAALRTRHLHGTAMVVSARDSADEDLHATLAEQGWDVLAASDWSQLVEGLGSGRVEVLLVHLCTSSIDALALIERVRRVPEWDAVRIIGLLGPADRSDQHDTILRSLDAALRRRGVPTPALLFDLADKLLTARPTVALGVQP